MNFNLKFKNFIILISLTTFLRGSFFVNYCNKDQDFIHRYGVQLVLAK